MVGAELPLLDMSIADEDTDSEESAAADKADDIAKFDEDPDVVFAEEKEGWHGCVSLTSKHILSSRCS